MNKTRLSVGAVLLLACATLLLQQSPGSGRTVLWENYNEPDYFDRQVRQARSDGIRSELVIVFLCLSVMSVCISGCLSVRDVCMYIQLSVCAVMMAVPLSSALEYCYPH